jgi:pimeloyl-ACP methyl ester carboxylesterase
LRRTQQFAPLLARLRGVRSIIPDRPGSGLSEGVGLDRIDLRRQAVSFLGDVLTNVGLESAAVVGNSMGGLWASWLALDRPGLAKRLALLGCPALALGTSGPLSLRLLGKPALGRRMLGTLPSGREGAYRVLGMLHESREVVDRAGASFADVMAASMELPGWTENWIGLLGNALTLKGANRHWAFGEADARTIAKPLLLIWGTRDPVGSIAIGQQFADLAGGRLIELEDAGHMPWLDEPAAIADAIAALIRVPSALAMAAV